MTAPRDFGFCDLDERKCMIARPDPFTSCNGRPLCPSCLQRCIPSTIISGLPKDSGQWQATPHRRFPCASYPWFALQPQAEVWPAFHLAWKETVLPDSPSQKPSLSTRLFFPGPRNDRKRIAYSITSCCFPALSVSFLRHAQHPQCPHCGESHLPPWEYWQDYR